jgi:hypothetical protein
MKAAPEGAVFLLIQGAAADSQESSPILNSTQADCAKVQAERIG